MREQHSRSEMLIGREALEKLFASRVAVFGLGGVGSYAAEFLARSGVGSLLLVDGDGFSASNLNRQLFALHSTLGMAKTEAARLRLLDINPELQIETVKAFYTPETAAEFSFDGLDYIIDCIDMVTAKIHLVARAHAEGVPVISAMGAGNKTDPSLVQVSDLSKTKICPLARVMRKELRKRGISHSKVVYSTEEAHVREAGAEAGEKDKASSETGFRRSKMTFDSEGRASSWQRQVGSMVFVPAQTGLLLASETVKDLISGI